MPFVGAAIWTLTKSSFSIQSKPKFQISIFVFTNSCCVKDHFKRQGQTYPLGKGRRLPWAPKSQGPPKMLFIYTRCALTADTQTTTTICVSELYVLLVYPACSKLKYNASEADCRARARSLFPSTHTPHVRGGEEQHFVKHRYVASLILHVSIAEIPAQPLPLSYVQPIWFYQTTTGL